MKNIYFLILIIFVITSSSMYAVSENSLILSVEKSVYSIGETVTLDVSLVSDEDFNGILNVQFINMEKIDYKSSFFEELINIKKGDYKEFNFPFEVSESIPNGKYYAQVSLLDNNNNLVLQKNISFSVVGQKEDFKLDLLICKDKSCSEKSKVFVKNQDIYLKSESEVKDIMINTTLILPATTIQQLILPTSIKAEQIGTYNLEVTASKEGYKTVTKKEQFGVIEKEANIPYTKPEGIKGFNWLYIIISIIILIIIGIILYLIKRENSRF